MNTSTEHILQCNQSEPLADASGRIENLMNENGVKQGGGQAMRPPDMWDIVTRVTRGSLCVEIKSSTSTDITHSKR